MFKSTASMVKGTICGLISGMIIGGALCCIIKDQKKMKKKAGRALHAVGDFIEQVPCMFK